MSGKKKKKKQHALRILDLPIGRVWTWTCMTQGCLGPQNDASFEGPIDPLGLRVGIMSASDALKWICPGWKKTAKETHKKEFYESMLPAIDRLKPHMPPFLYNGRARHGKISCCLEKIVRMYTQTYCVYIYLYIYTYIHMCIYVYYILIIVFIYVFPSLWIKQKEKTLPRIRIFVDKKR